MDQVEVIARVERRRKWSETEKAAVLAETDVPGTSVAAIARKHGIAKSVLYNWRSVRRAQAIAAMPGAGPVAFIPLGVVGRAEEDKVPAQLASSRAIENTEEDLVPLTTKPTGTDHGSMIEIAFSTGIRVRVDEFVSEKALMRVLRALKALM